MVREEILRAVTETKACDLRSEFLVVPEDLGSEDLRVVFQIAVQIGRPDVQVGELAEGRCHDPENPSEAISVVGAPGVTHCPVAPGGRLIDSKRLAPA